MDTKTVLTGTFFGIGETEDGESFSLQPAQKGGVFILAVHCHRCYGDEAVRYEKRKNLIVFRIREKREGLGKKNRTMMLSSNGGINAG